MANLSNERQFTGQAYTWSLTAGVWRKSCEHFQVYCYWQLARKGEELNVEDRTRKGKKMQNDNEREGKKENLKSPAHQLVSALRKRINNSIRGL